LPSLFHLPENTAATSIKVSLDTIVIRWQAFGNIRNLGIGPLISVIRKVGGAGSRRKRQTIKKALKIAEEFERAAKTKRTLKQVQNVLDRLHEEVSGQRVVRTTFREYLSDWLMARKAETASSTMDFYQTCLKKFVEGADCSIADNGGTALCAVSWPAGG
jgi:hypothetical protein